MTNKRIVPVGTVSHGTLREQDLFLTFWRLANSLGLYDRIAELRMPEFTDDCALDVEAYETLCEYICELEDMLCELCPEGWYFGSHIGDGSDFGFWPCED